MNALKRIAQSMDGQGAQPIVGIIAGFNPADHTAKVTLWQGTSAEYPTDWLPLGALATFAGGGGFVAPPIVGEQVLCVPEQNSHGDYHIIARIFSTSALPPSSPATGRAVQPGEVGVFTPGGAYLHLENGNIHTAGNWTHTGTTTLNGDVTTTGAIVNNDHHVDSTHVHQNSGGNGVGGVPV